MWKDAGKPRSGAVFDLYKTDKYAYKLRTKSSKNEADLIITNDLHSALCDKDNNSFWKLWKSKFDSCNKSKPKIVNGLTNSREIADEFSKYFGSICKPNSLEYNNSMRTEFYDKIKNYTGDFLSVSDFFSIELVSKTICELKTGRASGLDGLSAEHLHSCHPIAHLLITYFCNLMLLSGYVPDQFALGVTFPIPKCKLGSKMSTVEDFRGITVSPLISKILEKCIFVNFEKYFSSSCHQFGFKKKVSCAHAIFCARSTIDYFVNNLSTVSLGSLDVAKAFDRINHFTMFVKLTERYLPINLILLLLNWYKRSTAIVNWNGFLSTKYSLSAGVRQGGVLSPVLFSVYVNSLILSLQKQGLGCHIGLQCMSVLMYADDLILFSGSVSGLQSMIDLCIIEFKKLDLEINVKKSVCMRIGPKYKNECADLLINGIPTSWSKSFTYLGITFKSSVKFSIDMKLNRAKFYRAFNSIYCKIAKANEFTIVHLVKTFCNPVIMFGLEALNFNVSQLSNINNLSYNILAKIFKTFDHSSLDWCMFYVNYWPLKYEYFNRRTRFLNNLRRTTNDLCKTWFNVNGIVELHILTDKLNIANIKSDFGIRDSIWSQFCASLV